jgi:hypothetical protein
VLRACELVSQKVETFVSGFPRVPIQYTNQLLCALLDWEVVPRVAGAVAVDDGVWRMKLN